MTLTSEHLRKTRSRTPEEAFWMRAVPGPGCWRWIGSHDINGYAYYHPTGTRHIKGHRLGYEVVRGPIPLGMVLDHLCENRWCVNPDHLEPVTTAENNRRMQAALLRRRTHCKRCGLAMTPDNLAITKTGKRRCRACLRSYMRAYRAQRESHDNAA